MDRMTEQAGGPLTFGDIRRQEEAAAANESNDQPERWFAGEWASAPYEHRANLLADIGVEPGSKQLDEIADKPWNGLTASEKSRLTEAMKAREKARLAPPPKQPKPDAAAPVNTQALAQAGETEAAAPAGPAVRQLGSYGRTPSAATPVELRPNADGTLTPYTGKYPMVDYETGDPIVIPSDASDAEAVDAIRAAKAIVAKDRFYGLKSNAQNTPSAAPAAETATPSTDAEPAESGAAPTEITRDERIAAARTRIDGLKALLSCLGK